MGSVERFQESLEMLRKGMDLMIETASPLLEQQTQTVTAFESFMVETRQRLAALEKREQAREAQWRALEMNLNRTLTSFLPRVQSLLSQLEKRQVQNVPNRNALQELNPVASTSREAQVCNKTASDGAVGGGVKKKQDKKKDTVPASSPSPSASSSSSGSPDKQDDVLNRDLLQAVNRGQLTEVRRLIAAGADVNAKSQTGKTPLCVAALMGRSECLCALIDADADIRETSKEGFNALHFAAMYGKEPILQILLAAGIDVDVKSHDGMTALALASKSGHKACVSDLLLHSAYVDVKDCDRRTPLHHAVINNHIDVVSVLMVWGAQQHSLDKFQKSPLHYCVESQNESMVNFILLTVN